MLHQHLWGVYSLWGGGARSRFVLEKGVWTGAVLGIVLTQSPIPNPQHHLSLFKVLTYCENLK